MLKHLSFITQVKIIIIITVNNLKYSSCFASMIDFTSKSFERIKKSDWHFLSRGIARVGFWVARDPPPPSFFVSFISANNLRRLQKSANRYSHFDTVWPPPPPPPSLKNPGYTFCASSIRHFFFNKLENWSQVNHFEELWKYPIW